MSNPLGFYLTRMPDGTWLGIVPGAGDPEVWRKVEQDRLRAREAARLRPNLWVRFMDLLRSGLEPPQAR